MQFYSILKEEWDRNLNDLISSHTIFATLYNGFGLDYEIIKDSDIGNISYNNPRPATPLKSFFLPVKENVTAESKPLKPRIIIGAPNCDIEGLHLLDILYLDGDFDDIHYLTKRENTLLISSDCFSRLEYCHCTSYGVKPYADRIADIGLMLVDDTIIFRSISYKGELFLNRLKGIKTIMNDKIPEAVEIKHRNTETSLESSNGSLPHLEETADLIRLSAGTAWQKYSSHCVSCGACSAICPTCSCFLLIDKPAFEKVKQMDSCQYPGFERVAGGEDPLFELHKRFKNRYLCKYVWKPQKFNAVACTGCGRCIEACPGRINKNEIFMDLSILHNDA